MKTAAFSVFLPFLISATNTHAATMDCEQMTLINHAELLTVWIQETVIDAKAKKDTLAEVKQSFFHEYRRLTKEFKTDLSLIAAIPDRGSKSQP